MEPSYRIHSALPLPSRPRTWAAIDLTALRTNYRLLCGRIWERNRKIRPIAVVKADAYGHGAPACVRALLQEGCDCFAVSCVEEAVAVRRACLSVGKSADVLILGYTDPSEAERLAEEGLIQTVLSEEYAARLQAAAARTGVAVRVHLALDTGMNRIGFPARNRGEIGQTVNAIFSMRVYENLHIEGMFTHLSRADEAGEGAAFTEEQTRRFRAVRNRLRNRGTAVPFCHVCNSAAALTGSGDDRLFDGVRLGIALYGVSPVDSGLPLIPVMRLCSVVTHIHRVSGGEGVGYGAAWRADGERVIATLPIGYADGFMRAYSGANVTVETSRGPRRVPVAGRVCMDQCMLDVTGTAARVGDVVTLFGNDPRELSELATKAGSIEYETLCSVSARVPRVYAGDGKET